MTHETRTAKRKGVALGSFIGDALAMPVHWYYDRTAMFRDYGEVRDFAAPRHPHSGSILWRSVYKALNERGEILHDQARYWGQRGVHYHRNLKAGENTLNLQLALRLARVLQAFGDYDRDAYLSVYIQFMTTRGSHNDTYIEECHRHFFTCYARGVAPTRCGGEDIHIGGLAHVGLLVAWFGGDEVAARKAVRAHVSLTHTSFELLDAADVLVRVLCAVIDGVTMAEALARHASQWLPPKAALEWFRQPDSDVVGRRFSTACYIRESFPAALYLALKYADDPEAGLIANTNLGGDNCHRGAVLGALLGAASGTGGFPARWRSGLAAAGELEAYFEDLPCDASEAVA